VAAADNPPGNSAPTAFRSAIIPTGRLLPGILGLRGIAALAVVLFHIVHLASISAPGPFTFIAADFGKGVHLFFVLSAFSLMHSTEHTMSRPRWADEYFVKRFFRIAPLYYCLTAGMILWPAVKSGAWSVDFQALLLNLTFTFGFAPWKGIVWAGWSVGVEMLFYAIFPVLLMTVRTRIGTMVLLAISILVTYAARSALDVHYEHTVPLYRYNWAYFSFAANLCFFAMGMYAFRVVHTIDINSAAIRWYIPVAAVALIAALLLTDVGRPLKLLWKADLIVWGLAFAALSIWQSTWPSRWSANRLFEYLGERSYSIYLLHPVVIVVLKSPIQSAYAMLTPHLGAYAFFACAGLTLLPLLILSEVTYRLVELPSIRLGQRINDRKRQSMSSVVSKATE
jgi:peptidoglycan/LPS O-acetylase OafA/YrhL